MTNDLDVPARVRGWGTSVQERGIASTMLLYCVPEPWRTGMFDGDTLMVDRFVLAGWLLAVASRGRWTAVYVPAPGRTWADCADVLAAAAVVCRASGEALYPTALWDLLGRP